MREEVARLHQELVRNGLVVWTGGNVLIYARNSFLVTIPATAASILFGVLAGYVFSKLRNSEVIESMAPATCAA